MSDKMQVIYRKSKLMVSNPGRSRDSYLMFIVNSLELEMVEEIKLLGGDNKKLLIMGSKHRLHCPESQ